MMILAAGTGLRQGEIFGLTEDRVNFLKRTIEVDRQLAGSAKGQPIFGPPKTPSSARTVPLPSTVATELAEHIRIFGTGTQGMLFSARNGVPLRRGWFSTNVWVPARTKVRATIPEMPETAGMHDLRHFYASLLIRHSESVKVVQARLGHATAAETLDTYSHLWPDSDETTRAAIDAEFGLAPRSCGLIADYK